LTVKDQEVARVLEDLEGSASHIEAFDLLAALEIDDAQAGITAIGDEELVTGKQGHIFGLDAEGDLSDLCEGAAIPKRELVFMGMKDRQARCCCEQA
jgi:hypothetical protein